MYNAGYTGARGTLTDIGNGFCRKLSLFLDCRIVPKIVAIVYRLYTKVHTFAVRLREQ